MGDPFHTPTDSGHRGGTATPADRSALRRAWHAEVAITLFGAFVYFGVRVLVEGERSAAVANAERLQRFERRLGLDVEHSVQSWVIDQDPLRILGNLSYVWLHWPLLIVALVTLFALDPVRFRHLRAAMFVSGAIGLVIFAVLPTAPPRFMPGFVGTVSDDARRHYIEYPLSWTNQFAAVPSFHVGWTLVACLALAGLIGHRLGRAVVLAPAVLVGVSVVTTGNHYVADAVLGTVIAVGAYLITAPRRSDGGDLTSTLRSGDIVHQNDAVDTVGRYRRQPCPSTSTPPPTPHLPPHRPPPATTRSATGR